MSSIVEKAFDSTQKILRTIFRGTPNLFTTADLNRQIEAFDYRLKRLEWFRGVETDMTVIHNVGSGYNNYALVYSYIRVFGCTLYEGVQTSTTINVVGGYPTGGVGLFLTPSVVTYSDDATHTISGAKFVDGTSQPAADNEVITRWGFALLQTNIWDSPLDTPDKFILAEAGTVDVTDISGNAVPDGSYFIPLLSKDATADTFYPLFGLQHNISEVTRFFGVVKKDIQDSNLWGSYRLELTHNKFFAHLRVTMQRVKQQGGSENGVQLWIEGIELPADTFPVTMQEINVPVIVRIMNGSSPVMPTPGTPYPNGYARLIPNANDGTFDIMLLASYSYASGVTVYTSCEFLITRGPQTALGSL